MGVKRGRVFRNMYKGPHGQNQGVVEARGGGVFGYGGGSGGE